MTGFPHFPGCTCGRTRFANPAIAPVVNERAPPRSQRTSPSTGPGLVHSSGRPHTWPPRQPSPDFSRDAVASRYPRVARQRNRPSMSGDGYRHPPKTAIVHDGKRGIADHLGRSTGHPDGASAEGLDGCPKSQPTVRMRGAFLGCRCAEDEPASPEAQAKQRLG